MRAILNSLIIVGALALTSSCVETPTFEKSYSFDNNIWNEKETLSFEFDIDDLEPEYNFKLFLRNTTDYKYNNLWIFLETFAPDGSTGREPFQIRICNDDGSWIGVKSGTIVETALDFRRRKFPMKGTYKFNVELGTTSGTIDEVLDLGLIIDKVE